MGLSMHVRDVGVALWRQRPLVVLVLLVTGAALAAGLVLAPKTYTATARLSAPADPAATALLEESGELDARRATLAALADGEAGAEQVRARTDVDRTVDELRDEIRGAWVEGTVLVEISVEDRDPRVAAEVADAVVAVLADGTVGQPSLDGAFDLDAAAAASVPTSFSSPDLRLAVAVGVLVAVGLALAGAGARERRTPTVDDAATAEELTAAPLLAHLVAPADLTAMPALSPGTVEADLFRHLRVTLAGEADRGAAHVVIAGITAGPASGDVNVWVGANVAIALAGTGRRVLLVDARMGERFGTPEDAPDTPGLYDVLLGTDLADAVSPGPVERLQVLPPGTWGDQPVAELLAQRFTAVMARAAADFDHVVVLGPPLDQVEDSRVMAVDSALVLTMVEGSVSATALRAHTERVRAVGATLLGVVLVARSDVVAA